MRDAVSKEIAAMEPVLTKCLRGGWLAVSPPGSVLPIGTMGPTEEEARAAFAKATLKWAALGEEEAEPDTD